MSNNNSDYGFFIDLDQDFQTELERYKKSCSSKYLYNKYINNMNVIKEHDSNIDITSEKNRLVSNLDVIIVTKIVLILCIGITVCYIVITW